MEFKYIQKQTAFSDYVLALTLHKCSNEVTTYFSKVTIITCKMKALNIDINICTGNYTITINHLLLTQVKHDKCGRGGLIKVNILVFCQRKKTPSNISASAFVTFSDFQIMKIYNLTTSDLISIKTQQSFATSSVINSLTVHFEKCTFSDISSYRILSNIPLIGSILKPTTSIFLINTTFSQINVKFLIEISSGMLVIEGSVIFTKINIARGVVLKSTPTHIKFKYYTEFSFIRSYALIETKYILSTTILFASNKFQMGILSPQNAPKSDLYLCVF